MHRSGGVSRSKVVVVASAAVAVAVPLLAVPGGPAALGYQRPATVQRVSVDAGGHQFTTPSGGDLTGNNDGGASMSPTARFVAFTNSRTIVADRTNLGAGVSVLDVYLRDRLLGRTVKVSVAPDGSDGIGVGTCGGASEPAVSADGRYVAFSSCYANLVTGQQVPDAVSEVYVRDVRAGTTSMVSVGVGGLPAVTGARNPTISDDGRRIAFFSASDLVGQDAPCEQTDVTCVEKNLAFIKNRVWVRDLRTHTTVLASVASNGTPADGGSDNPSISPDGRYVLFLTTAGNLSTVDDNHCTDRLADVPTCSDVYLHDLTTGRTELISVGLDGKAGSAQPTYRAQMISRDDRYVAFQSTGAKLVPANWLGGFAYYVRDRHTGRTERAAVDSTGQPIDPGDLFWSLSGNGRYLAFTNSSGSHCVDTPIAVHDLVTGATTAAGYAGSTAAYCKHPTGGDQPHISSDGRYVEFVSAGKLTAGDSNKVSDVFVQDRGAALATNAMTVAAGSHPAGAPLLVESDVSGDTDSAWSALGGDIVGATVAYRPASDDVFVRLSVAHMSALSLLAPTRYGLRFAVGATTYTATTRCAGLNGAATMRLTTASGALRAQLPAYCGTTGEEVVWSIPRSALTSRQGAELRPIVAFTGVTDDAATGRDVLSF